MYCNKCGTYLPDDADFCPYCGAPAAKQTQQVIVAPAPRSKNTIVIGAIIAVAVVLIFAIGCFTFLTKRNQDVQLQAAQAAQQSDSVSTTDNSTAEKTTSTNEQAPAPVDMQTAQDTSANKQTSDASDTKPESSSTTVTNNYYYYGAHAAHDDEYYTNSKDYDYLWPTDSQYISTSDLSSMNRDTVAAIRNEIYARHGYAFSTSRWQSYFSDKAWYHRDNTCTENTVMSRLSSIERANIDTISLYEESKGWR